MFYTNYAFLKTHYSSIYLAITCASLGSMMILGSAYIKNIALKH